MSSIDMRPWQELSKEMLATRAYNPRGLDPQTLRSDWENCLGIVKWQGNRIVAHGALEKTNLPDVWQVRKIYVAQENRGNGLLSYVLDRLLQVRVCKKSTTLFAITADSKLLRALNKVGFEDPYTVTPAGIVDWAERVGFKDRLLTEYKNKGRDSRYLMIRRPVG